MTSLSPSAPPAMPEPNACGAERRPAERGDTARRVVLVAGSCAVAAGIITLVGWATDMPRLTDWKNDGISMFPNTAACAAMCGVALLASDLRRRGARLLVRLLAGFVIVVAGLTLFEHVTSVNLGIDTLVFERSWGQAAAAAPSRMGPPASLSFFALGTALVLLTFGTRARKISAALGGLVTAIGMLAFTGHLYGASQMYTLPRLTGIAMQTASVLVVLAIGLLAALPEVEPLRTLRERSAAGLLTRQALPILIVLALGLGAARVAIERYGLVDLPFGTALRSVIELGLLIGLLWWAASRVRTYERALRTTEADVRRHAAQLGALLGIAESAREEAEAANRQKDEFLAMLAHELRNPLAAVRNAVTAATLDDASRPRALEIALRQSEQLGRIVDDLLDVARITRGAVPLRRERVSLAEVLHRASDGCRALMEERGHTFTVSMSADTIALDADAARLEQAVANVLTNAAKYTDAGGTVTLIVERDGDSACVRVRDNGIGISSDTLPRVFDLFTQGQRGLDRAQGGLGIGLTLVRRIVELHGGTVEAKSPGPGAGAEFVLRLPALPASVGLALSQTVSLKSPERHPARVLMVEDNRDEAESMVMILELHGHHVRVVHDGNAALKAARANVPDLMLIDIGLPGMNGYDVARAVRTDPLLKDVMLVALTGYGRSEDRAEALAAGFNYHLVKPVDLDVLDDLVGKIRSASESW